MPVFTTPFRTFAMTASHPQTVVHTKSQPPALNPSFETRAVGLHCRRTFRHEPVCPTFLSCCLHRSRWRSVGVAPGNPRTWLQQPPECFVLYIRSPAIPQCAGTQWGAEAHPRSAGPSRTSENRAFSVSPRRKTAPLCLFARAATPNHPRQADWRPDQNPPRPQW